MGMGGRIWGLICVRVTVLFPVRSPVMLIKYVLFFRDIFGEDID
jgi:hypothetical protein